MIALPRVGASLAVRLALVVVLLAALVATGLFGARVLEARADDARRDAVVSAARQIAANFTTLDYRTFDEDVQLVLDGATGSFRDEFAAGVEQTKDVVTSNEAVSTGTVSEAALVSADDDSARVLLVVDTEVTNTATPEPTPRHYRVQLDLTRVADSWLASDLQFVG